MIRTQASDDPGAGDLATEFVALNDLLHSGGDPAAALQRLVELAVRTVPGCDWCAITAWPAHKQPRSLSSSDKVSSAVDRLQYDLGEGPCLTAAAESEIAHIADVSADTTWPRFSKAVLAGTPVRSVMSYYLVDLPHRSALNMYASEPNAFDTDSVNTAALFAAHARVLLIHVASTDKAANLEHALSTSRQIGAAMGILMNAHRITADQAFELLRSSSQHLHRKLHDIAYDVTQTGTLPDGS